MGNIFLYEWYYGTLNFPGENEDASKRGNVSKRPALGGKMYVVFFPSLRCINISAVWNPFFESFPRLFLGHSCPMR